MIAEVGRLRDLLRGRPVPDNAGEPGSALAAIISAPHSTPSKHLLRASDDSGYVYFAQFSKRGAIKIGFSYNPARRITEFGNGSPSPVRCLGVMFGGRRHERRLHLQFEGLSIGGEWFRADDTLTTYIKEHAIPLEALIADDAAE